MSILILDSGEKLSAEELGDRVEKAGLTPDKARKILHDKEVHGKPITDQQRKYFGAVASGTAQKAVDPKTPEEEERMEAKKEAKAPNDPPKLPGVKKSNAIVREPVVTPQAADIPADDSLAKSSIQDLTQALRKIARHLRGDVGDVVTLQKSRDAIVAELKQRGQAAGLNITALSTKKPLSEVHKAFEPEESYEDMHIRLAQQPTGIAELTDFAKSKYIKRTGTPGNYKYEYADKKGYAGPKGTGRPAIETRTTGGGEGALSSVPGLDKDLDDHRVALKDLKTVRAGKTVENLDMAGALHNVRALGQTIRTKFHRAVSEATDKGAIKKLKTAAASVQKKTDAVVIATPEDLDRIRTDKKATYLLDTIPKLRQSSGWAAIKQIADGDSGPAVDAASVMQMVDNSSSLSFDPETTKQLKKLNGVEVARLVAKLSESNPSGEEMPGLVKQALASPVKKSMPTNLDEWLQKSEDTEMSETDDLQKCMNDGRSRTEKWAEKFWSESGMRVRALEVAKDMMVLDKDEAAFDNTNVGWSERNDWSRAKRDAYQDKRNKQRETFTSRRDAIRKKMAGLDVELVDYQLKEARMRLSMGKSEDAPVQDQEIQKSEVNEMSGIDVLATYGQDPITDPDDIQKSQTIPTGNPKQKLGQGEEQGGKVAAVGTTGGSSDSAPGPGQNAEGQLTGVPAGKGDKLSEDDEEPESQMSPGKKPIESARKSMAVPGNQRALVAQENAQAVVKLRKGTEDVDIPPGELSQAVAEPAPVEKGRTGQQGMVGYSEQADIDASELVKANEFYSGGAPGVIPFSRPIGADKVCLMCHTIMSKSLTACPKCGEGTVVHRVLPGGGAQGAHDGEPLIKSQPGRSQSGKLQPRVVKDVKISK